MCSWCGSTHKPADTNCTQEKRISKSLKYFNFDITKIGTSEVHKEVLKAKENAIDMYNGGMSLPEICEETGYPDSGTLGAFFRNILKIELRNNGESMSIALLRNRRQLGVAPQYHNGYHTTWNDQRVHYRSSYELDFYMLLDSLELEYLVEPFRIRYFDSTKNKERTAIPDIFIPSTNTIIEVKSNYTYDEQNIKDRFKIFKKQGYNVLLILDKNYDHFKFARSPASEGTGLQNRDR